jgi:integrase
MGDKKFFVPALYDAFGNIDAEWFVYYYKPNFPTDKKGVRIRIYGGINYAKTESERKKIADRINKEVIELGKKFTFPENPTKTITKKLISLGHSELTQSIDELTLTLKKTTLRSYKVHLRAWVDFLGDKNVLSATKADARIFINNLIKKGLSSKTIKSYHMNLKNLYNKYAYINDLEDFKNPFNGIPYMKVQSTSKMYFNQTQIENIKNYLKKHNPELWLACQLQYYCFTRPNELRQLKVQNFNLDMGFIEVPGNISKNGKTQKVSIPYALVDELKFVEKLNYNEFIFKSRNGKCIGRNTFSKQHRYVLRRLKIQGNYSFYSWKHTGVVKAVKAGIHIKDLQLQLRHHSLDMVNEYLKNLGVMDMERIRDLFPAI